MIRDVYHEVIIIDKTSDLQIDFPLDVIEIGIQNRSDFIIYVRDVNGTLMHKLHNLMYVEFINPNHDIVISTNTTRGVEFELLKYYDSI